MVEVSVDGEYVVGPLVVGYEYVGCMGVDVFAPFDSDLDHGHDTEKGAPTNAGKVARPATQSQHAKDDGDCRRQYRGRQQNRAMIKI